MVYRLNRNRCQYCRFKKCLAVGMSRDSVRYGRVPKRTRERMTDEQRVTSMTGDTEQEAEMEKKQLALYDIILSVSQAHHSNCAYVDDKVKNLQQRPIYFVSFFLYFVSFFLFLSFFLFSFFSKFRRIFCANFF